MIRPTSVFLFLALVSLVSANSLLQYIPPNGRHAPFVQYNPDPNPPPPPPPSTRQPVETTIINSANFNVMHLGIGVVDLELSNLPMIRPTSVFVFLAFVSFVIAYRLMGNPGAVPHHQLEISETLLWPSPSPPAPPPPVETTQTNSANFIFNYFGVAWLTLTGKGIFNNPGPFRQPPNPFAQPPPLPPPPPSTEQPVETTQTNFANFNFNYFGIGALLMILAAL
ncbi:unnamed protein product [Caenorhabditis nigoni]